jgi:hypothetical protein
MTPRIIRQPPAVRYKVLRDLHEGRCFWAEALREDNPAEDITDDELGMVYIPNCMGGAVGGPTECTCDRALSDKEENWRKRYRALLKEFNYRGLLLDWARAKLQREGHRHYPLVGEIRP